MKPKEIQYKFCFLSTNKFTTSSYNYLKAKFAKKILKLFYFFLI